MDEKTLDTAYLKYHLFVDNELYSVRVSSGAYPLPGGVDGHEYRAFVAAVGESEKTQLQ